MGLLGMIFPEEYDGMGGSYVLYATAVVLFREDHAEQTHLSHLLEGLRR